MGENGKGLATGLDWRNDGSISLSIDNIEWEKGVVVIPKHDKYQIPLFF